SIGPRYATIGGFIIGVVSALIGLVYFILKLMNWEQYLAGTFPILFGVFFLGGMQLFFIGLIGEYIMKINTRVMRHPLVVEEERLNFSESGTEGKKNA
ncbi:MAG: glycosyltransferase, partial [Ruthenibacterium sp.]